MSRICTIYRKWFKVFSLFKTSIEVIKMLKELFILVFKKDSRIVMSYVILILAGQMTFEQVPNLYNLREMVELVLTESAVA